MSKKKLSKLLALYLPYVVIGLLATNLGEAWRLAVGKELGDKIVSLMGTIPAAFANPLPSLHPFDLFIGLCCGAGMRLAVYLKGKNAKKYRHGMEYGSARWGTREDIAPYIDPVFQNNVILTKTESLTMNSRPKDPKTARNKNVLVIGGSGSGKTRFWLKPNLMQMHSSYVVTDPKGTILVECGKMLQRGAPKLGKDGKPMKDKHGKVIYEPYRIKVLNTINFRKSMHYNPFAYIHSEKDILKLVTTLIANTKGEGKAGDDFWVKAETLLYCALIGYIHYEAPVEEQNFSTLIEFINAMEVREDDEEFKNPVDLMFDALEAEKPNHFAVRQYKKYKLAAGVALAGDHAGQIVAPHGVGKEDQRNDGQTQTDGAARRLQGEDHGDGAEDQVQRVGVGLGHTVHQGVGVAQDIEHHGDGGDGQNGVDDAEGLAEGLFIALIAGIVDECVGQTHAPVDGVQHQRDGQLENQCVDMVKGQGDGGVSQNALEDLVLERAQLAAVLVLVVAGVFGGFLVLADKLGQLLAVHAGHDLILNGIGVRGIGLIHSSPSRSH